MIVKVRPRGGIAVLDWGAGARRCAFGRGGIAHKEREGDGVTPVGNFPIRRVLYRADRLEAPGTLLACAALAPDDGWCDAPGDAAYNLPVALPYRASAEALWREDHLYDIIVPLGFNDEPVVAGRGSAIFLHLARPDYGPTEGCLALGLADLLALLAAARPGDILAIADR